MRIRRMAEANHRRWNVRQASKADLPVWARMLASLHRGASSEELLREIGDLIALDEPYVAFLAFDHDDRAVGVIDARVRNYAEGSPDLRGAYLEDLWVEPEARNKGVARALLAAVEDWARAEGLHWLGSDTTPDNAVSLRWHSAVGFSEVERLVVFGKPLD